MLLHMYKKKQYKQNGNSSDKELIDISSDDDVSKVESKLEKDERTSEVHPGCTEESSQVPSMVTVLKPSSEPELATTKPEMTVAKQETVVAKPEMSTSKSETSVKSKIVCLVCNFLFRFRFRFYSVKL